MNTYRHPDFIPPGEHDAVIWRYMDFAKFVSMLDHGSLYFPAVAQLGDPFEGSYPRACETLPDGSHLSMYISPDDWRERVFPQLKQMWDWTRNWSCASCWHINPTESAAMWRLYAGTNQAISIRSTYGGLRALLPDDVLIGQMNYVDYETHRFECGWRLTPLVYKRRSYAHENELRAISAPLPEPNREPPKGRWFQMSLVDLIREIRVAPTADSWFSDLVASVARKYNLRVPVERSDLDKTPLL